MYNNWGENMVWLNNRCVDKKKLWFEHDVNVFACAKIQVCMCSYAHVRDFTVTV